MPASPSENQTRWRKRKRDSQISRRHQKHEEEEEEEDDDDDDENPNGATRSTIRRTKRTTTTVIRNLTWRRSPERTRLEALSSISLPLQITDGMEKAIKNKVAKAVVPAIDVMFQALSDFGAKIVPPKRILKMLPELFDHQDQN
ncbi:hypothetical protein AAZX31_18G094500 [Glycine max]